MVQNRLIEFLCIIFIIIISLSIPVKSINKPVLVTVSHGRTSNNNGGISLPYNIEMGKYEITNSQYVEFLNSAGVTKERKYKGKYLINSSQIVYENNNFIVKKGLDPDRNIINLSNYPVIGVSWYGAVAYCNWLSKQENLTPAYDLDVWALKDKPENLEGYRLPTLIEWEYVARGGKHGNPTMFAGSNSLEEVAWYKNNSGAPGNSNLFYSRGTMPVGMKSGNELGIFDMIGNVSEWTNSFRSTNSCYTCGGDFNEFGKDNVTKEFNEELKISTTVNGSYGSIDLMNRFVGFRITRISKDKFVENPGLQNNVKGENEEVNIPELITFLKEKAVIIEEKEFIISEEKYSAYKISNMIDPASGELYSNQPRDLWVFLDSRKVPVNNKKKLEKLDIIAKANNIIKRKGLEFPKLAEDAKKFLIYIKEDAELGEVLEELGTTTTILISSHLGSIMAKNIAHIDPGQLGNLINQSTVTSTENFLKNLSNIDRRIFLEWIQDNAVKSPKNVARFFAFSLIKKSINGYGELSEIARKNEIDTIKKAKDFYELLHNSHTTFLITSNYIMEMEEINSPGYKKFIKGLISGIPFPKIADWALAISDLTENLGEYLTEIENLLGELSYTQRETPYPSTEHSSSIKYTEILYKHFVANRSHAPTTPILKSPGDGTKVSNNSITLSWEKSNDLDSSKIFYDIYIGTSKNSLNKVKGLLNLNHFEIYDLNYNTTYYWKVISKDNEGNENESCIWSFTIEKCKNEKSNIKWVTDLGEEIYWSSPAISKEGSIYIGTNNGNLYSFDSNGNIKWKFKTEGPIYSSPVISKQGIIYISDMKGNFYAINLNGTKIWEIKFDEIPPGIFSTSAIGNNGTIYIAINAGKLFAIDSQGKIKWTIELGNGIASSPAIGSDGSIYIGSINGKLYSINSDGEINWFFQTDNSILSSPAIGKNGTIYFCSNDNYLYALKSNGNMKWKYKIANNKKARYSSPIIGIKENIYVSNYPGNTLYSISSEGALIWKYTIEENEISVFTPIMNEAGVIFMVDQYGKIFAINSDGTKKRSFRIDSGCVGSLTIGKDGTIYIGSSFGKIYAIDGGNNKLANSPWPMFHKNACHTGRN